MPLRALHRAALLALAALVASPASPARAGATTAAPAPPPATTPATTPASTPATPRPATPPATPTPGPPPAATLRGTFEQSPGGVGATTVVALDGNAAAWAARWRAMASARTTIDASYFIIDGDVFGLAFLAHLHERARAGVQVRLLLDGRGSAPLALPLAGLDNLQELAATGNADVRIYNPPLLQLVRTAIERSAVPVSAGTHNKILVVDDARAIVGGRNIGTVYFASAAENRTSVVDSDVEVTGAAATALADVVRGEHSRWFKERIRRDVVNIANRQAVLTMIHAAMDAWLQGSVAATPRAKALAQLEAAAVASVALPPDEARAELRAYLPQLVRLRSIHGSLHAPAPPTRVAEAHVVAARGRAEARDESANDAIVRAIGTARHRVWVQSPYFMLTPRLLGAFERAAERGVEIVVVTNGPTSSDNEAAQALFIDTWPEVQARVRTLRVFAGAGRMLHVKRVIVDDELTLVGSHNLDPLSSHLNSEVVVALWSIDVNHDAQHEMERIRDGGEVYEYRIRRDAHGEAARDVDDSVIVAFGPGNHLTPKRLEELRALKRFLFSVRGIWDLEFVAW